MPKLYFQKTNFYLLLFSLVVASHNLKCQVIPRQNISENQLDSLRPEKKRPLMLIQAEFENGGMIPNNSEVKETFKDIYYSGVNLRFGWQTERGKNIYNQIYNYPIYGVGVYASTFRKAEIGTPYAVYGFVSIPMSPYKIKRLNCNYRIALGLADDFIPYDPVKNPRNIMIGSPVNVYVDFGIQGNFRLNKYLQLGLGFAFHHFSNGSISQPNKGINLVPVALSMSYRPSDKVPDFGKSPVPKFPKTNYFSIAWSGGIKQYSPENKEKYFKSTLGLYWCRALGYKFRMGAGADIFFSESGYYAEIAGDKKGKFGSIFSGGPAFYIDHVLSRDLFINGNVGYYLHRNEFNGEMKPIFLRIGLRYKFWNDVFAGVSIKAHQGKADYIEWTLGYMLGKKRE